MASKKEKLLESAQRFLLKGQLDKAIKDYQQVVAMEPKEIRYRQRLAELLVRDHRKDEAIAQYEDIGKHYADNSYFLKAIAIYKQVQRLSPGDNNISLTIASLNHQQGLIGNALAEYGQVAAQLEKDGALREALKVVEKMLGVDAEHVATRLKQAELLCATGAKEDSLRAFSALLASLNARGRAAEAEAVSARIGELFPEASIAPVQEQADHFNVQGFGIEDVPGVADELSETADELPEAADELPAPWEMDEPSMPEPAASEPELPDLFAKPAAEQEEAAAPFQSAFEPQAPAAEPASAWEEEIELDLDDDFGAEFAAPAVAEDGAAEAQETVPEAGPETEPEPVPEAGVDLQLDFSLNLDFDEAVHSVEDDARDQELHGLVELDLSEESHLELSLPEDGAESSLPWLETEEPEPVAEAHLPQDLPAVDLARPEELPAEPEPEEQGAAARGWEEIYPGCDDQAELDLEELESHYDLGVGYKEMGMYGGAIKELDVAARNPRRRVTCLTLQAICYREKGEPDKAEELLRRGLALDVLERDDRSCLEYELAVLLEGRGGFEEAMALYREVRRVDPAYRDVAARLSALSGEEHLDIIDLELEEA